MSESKDRIVRYRRSTWHGPLRLVAHLIIGLHRDDGSTYMTRWEYLCWAWGALYRKVLFGPVRCALGWHRIGPRSDTGIGRCGICRAATMDVWCLDCDCALEVPIDDVVEWPSCRALVEQWNRIRGEEAES